jgi:CubicO group peptidase (beta-lactamase class C family)
MNKIFTLVPFILLLALTGGLASADQPVENSHITPTAAAAFFDSFFLSEMSANQIPGAVLAMVQGDSIFYAKGYGKASIETAEVMDPEQTVVRAASISKLITATAVLQLVEARQIQLEDDVNDYLDFPVGNPRLPAIKVIHLLTHRAGLDERFIQWAHQQKKLQQPLGQYLKNWMPPQVHGAGQYYEYSNHGYALLGYLVERVSGMPFCEYVKNYILTPLKMTKSDFCNDPELRSRLAQGYQYRNGDYHPSPYLYYNGGPAASMLTTAQDMAHFMIAQLNSGVFESMQLLESSTVEQMQREVYANHPMQGGTALGFWSSRENGLRTLEHAGDTPGFSSLLFMLPQERMGFFVSLTANSFPFREKLVTAFMDHFFPSGNPENHNRQRIALNRFQGKYAGPFFASRSIEKLPQLLVQFAVNASGDRLQLDYPVELSPPQYWQAVNDTVFGELDGNRYLVFEQDPQHDIKHMFIEPGRYPPFTLSKLGFWQTTQVQLFLFGFFLLCFLVLFALSWLPQAKSRMMPTGAINKWAMTVWRLNRWVSLLNLICLGGVFMIIAQVYTSFSTSSNQLTGLYLLLSIPFLHLVTTAINMWVTLKAFQAKATPYVQKNYQLVVTLIFVLFGGFLHYWNFIGYKI